MLLELAESAIARMMPANASTQSPMLIHAMILAAVTNESPSSAPFDARMFRFAADARNSATIAGMTGQRTNDTIAHTSAAMALPSVRRGAYGPLYG